MNKVDKLPLISRWHLLALQDLIIYSSLQQLQFLSKLKYIFENKLVI